MRAGSVHRTISGEVRIPWWPLLPGAAVGLAMSLLGSTLTEIVVMPVVVVAAVLARWLIPAAWWRLAVFAIGVVVVTLADLALGLAGAALALAVVAMALWGSPRRLESSPYRRNVGHRGSGR